MTILQFGKYKYDTCEEVLQKDPVYVRWCLGVKSDNPWFIDAQEGFRKLMGEKTEKEKTKERARLPWWDVLEVSPTDGEEEIKKAYRRQMSLYHPDKVSQLGAELRDLANEKSKEINAAYEAAMKARA